jgi:hypothetical protein
MSVSFLFIDPCAVDGSPSSRNLRQRISRLSHAYAIDRRLPCRVTLDIVRGNQRAEQMVSPPGIEPGFAA